MVLFTGSFAVAFGGAYLQSQATGETGPNAAAVGGLLVAFAPAFATSVKAIREYGPGHDETWARVGKDFAEAKNLNERSETGGYLELFYKVSFWTSLVVGGSFAFSPLSPLAIVNETEPSSQLIQRAFGLATVFLLAPTQYVLVDAAKRGRLGGGTFKKLNLSIAASIALIDWMTIYTFGAATALSPTAAQLENASGGVLQLRRRARRFREHRRRLFIPRRVRQKVISIFFSSSVIARSLSSSDVSPSREPSREPSSVCLVNHPSATGGTA